MLKNLKIQNFALIQETEVKFNNGLTVITGETGAGKSILLGALGLTLGNRADVAVLSDKTKKCIIEVHFDIQKYNLDNFFKTHELDKENITVIRREITPEGKSRAFINDTPVNLNVLKEFGENLIDIHSQHETLLLKETNFQFELVDAFANTSDDFNQYKKEFTQLQKLKKQLNELTEQEVQAKKDLDYYQFQFQELEEANLKVGELEQIEQECETLENAEFIKTNLAKSASIISDGDENILTALAAIKHNLQTISKYGKQFTDLFERLQSTAIELKELSADIENCQDEVIYDPTRLEEINFQIDKINRLLKKHNVNTVEELLTIKDTLESKLQQFTSLGAEIEKTQKEILIKEKNSRSLAETLSQKRKKATPDIEIKIKDMLSTLSMSNAQFKIEISSSKELIATGIDTLAFLFTANKGIEFKELYKTASGGELSRLMLCLKAILAQKTNLPTIIFDEIDTGVSGDVADKIGTILFEMGKAIQVIAITHLPQMASKGENHLFVYKTDSAEKTISNIKSLSKSERIEEIAKMLSSGKPTETALKNAKELLNA
jgi:DNA repair protein RecN (Recombination protein N)